MSLIVHTVCHSESISKRLTHQFLGIAACSLEVLYGRTGALWCADPAPTHRGLGQLLLLLPRGVRRVRAEGAGHVLAEVVREDGELLVAALQLALVLDGVRQGVRQVREGVRNVVLHLYEDEEIRKVERLAGLIEERDVTVARAGTDNGQHSVADQFVA